VIFRAARVRLHGVRFLSLDATGSEWTRVVVSSATVAAEHETLYRNPRLLSLQAQAQIIVYASLRNGLISD